MLPLLHCLALTGSGGSGAPLKREETYWVMNDDFPTTSSAVAVAPQSDPSPSPVAGGINRGTTGGGGGGGATPADNTSHRKVLSPHLDAGGDLEPWVKAVPGPSSSGLGDCVGGSGTGEGGGGGGGTSSSSDAGGSGGVAGMQQRWGKVLGRRPLVEGLEMSDLEAQLRSPAKVCVYVFRVCWIA